jgi:hypothetical protein
MSDTITAVILGAAVLGLVHLVVGLLWYRAKRTGKPSLRNRFEGRTGLIFGFFEVSGSAGRYPQRLTLFSINPPGPSQNCLTITVRSRGFYFTRRGWLDHEAYR